MRSSVITDNSLLPKVAKNNAFDLSYLSREEEDTRPNSSLNIPATM